MDEFINELSIVSVAVQKYYNESYDTMYLMTTVKYKKPSVPEGYSNGGDIGELDADGYYVARFFGSILEPAGE